MPPGSKSRSDCESDSLSSASSSRLQWHPKLTPYRLTVLSTIIAFGTVKLIESRTGNSVVPITLEWTSGVVITQILYWVGLYEHHPNPPKHLAWLFHLDCLDAPWAMLSLLSIPRPVYESEEHWDATHRHPRQSGRARAFLTVYRVVFSATLLSVGMVKAAMGYVGYSNAVNWVEWSAGTVVASLFYCVGLYEDNSLNYWPRFFTDDCTDSILALVIGTMFAFELVVLIALITLFAYLLRKFWVMLLKLKNEHVDVDPTPHSPLTGLSADSPNVPKLRDMQQIAMSIVFLVSLVLLLRLVRAMVTRQAGQRFRVRLHFGRKARRALRTPRGWVLDSVNRLLSSWFTDKI